MERLKQVGISIVYFFIVSIIFLITTVYGNIDLENYELLLILNATFRGLIPIFVASIAIRTYLNNNLFNALIFGCGILIFGLGSISSGIWAVMNQTPNVSITVYNICALLSSVCILYSILHDEKNNQRWKIEKGKHYKVGLSLSSVGLIVLIINYVSIEGLIPAFVNDMGYTFIRVKVLSTAIAFYFVSALLYWKQYKKRNRNDHFWYALALLMISMGLFGVSVSSKAGNLLGWVGRVAQYIGCLYALIPVVTTFPWFKDNKIAASDLLVDFFSDDEANYLDLIDSSPDSIISIDEENVIFIANKSANETFGKNLNSILQASFLDFLEQPYQDAVRRELDVYRRTGNSALIGQTHEMLAKDRSGHVFPVEISFTVRHMQSQYALSMIIRDITESKDFKERLLETNIQLENANSELVAINAQLENTNAVLKVSTSELLKGLEYAREMQQFFLPHEMPQNNSISFDVEFLAAQRLSGDFYNVINLDHNNIAIYIGDVSGHGISASMLTVFAYQNIVHLKERSDGPILEPGVVLKTVYRSFNRTNVNDEKFILMLYGIYNTEDKTFTYSSAAINVPPYIIKKSGEILEIDVTGFPICKLGDFISPIYENRTIQLEAGDKILFYSDGLVEAKNESGKMYSNERLKSTLYKHYHLNGPDLKKILLEDFFTYIGIENDLQDDVTLLIVSILD